jgi:phosphoglycolate phosphatase
MPSPPIVVLDLDGTLADSAQDLIATLNVVLTSEGLEAIPLARARDLIGAGARPLIERGFALHGRPLEPARLDRLYAMFLDHYHRNIAVHTVLFPGVVAALDGLAARGCRLAVCTNKLEGHAVTLLTALGITDRFAAITGKDTFPVFKPDPGHLTGTIARAGGDPARAVMVGDSETDVLTAKAAGIPVVAVSFGYTRTPARALGADIVIDHFDDLALAVERLVPASSRRLAAS